MLEQNNKNKTDPCIKYIETFFYSLSLVPYKNGIFEQFYAIRQIKYNYIKFLIKYK